MIWKEKKNWLLILGVVLLANLAFFFTYRVRYEERVEGLNRDLAAAQGKLATAKQRHATAEADLTTYKHAVSDINTVYNDLWSTREKRLTATISSIKKLGDRCDLDPTTFSYTWEPGEKNLNVESMSISFAVSGTYAQIRKFVNLVEVSPDFVIIDQISVSGSDPKSSKLELAIRVRTLFKEVPQATGTATGAVL